ncbi:MAG: glycoside hydrolase family 3 protein [Clostridium sp.]|nr:glycoside hydrolase family 3 protein [Clostridium sp.]
MKTKRTKRVLAALLALALMWNLSACGAAAAVRELIPGAAGKEAAEETSEEMEAVGDASAENETAGETSGENEAAGEAFGENEAVLENDASGENETAPENEASGMLAALDNVMSDTGYSGAGPSDAAEEILRNMTLEQKIAQLFFVSPEALTGVSGVTRTGDIMKSSFAACPVGGLLYSAPNLQTPEQTTEMLTALQQFATETSGFPVFISIDEEGGRVKRIGGNAAFGETDVGSMKSIGDTGDITAAKQAGNTIGGYLHRYGFNMDFAPDADVLTNPDNTVIGNRSFGSDAQMVSAMAAAYSGGLAANGILACYKHFPGHGGTGEDSHEGFAYTYKTPEELRACDLVPFADGIKGGVKVIMAAHVSCPGVTGNDTPATLSPEIITGILRKDLGFDGIIITDALDMGAISNHYGRAEACVKALQAGCDMLLCCGEFRTGYEGVLAAVRSGGIPESRIDESVLRILRVKETIGR